MKNIELALQEMAERAEERRLRDPVDIRSELASTVARRQRVRAAAMVVSAAAAAAVLIAVVAPNPFLTSPPPVGQTTTPPQPSPSTDDDNAAVAEITGVFGTRVGFRAVAQSKGTYVAVGDSSRGDGQTPIWWSEDAQHWNRVSVETGPRTANVWDVVAADGVFVAVGVEGARASAAWFSADGSEWTRHREAPPRFRPNGVAATRLGLVAWGMGRTWLSTDGGRTWTEGTDGVRFSPTRYSHNPCWVEERGNQLVAFVMVERAGDDWGRLYSSTDGSDWVPSSGNGLKALLPAAECSAYERLHAAASGPDGLVYLDPWGEDETLFVEPSR